MNRDLYHTELVDSEPETQFIDHLNELAKKHLQVGDADLPYVVWTQEVVNSAYEQDLDPIRILMKDGAVQDISTASDLSNVEVLSKKVKKYAITFPKELLKR